MTNEVRLYIVKKKKEKKKCFFKMNQFGIHWIKVDYKIIFDLTQQ